MLVKAVIVMDFEASDFIDAGRHQKEIERLADQLRGEYPSLELSFSERRRKRGLTTQRPRERPINGTGRLSHYAD